MPGTDTCIKIGGYVRAEVNVNAGGSFAVPATLNLNNRNAAFDLWRTRAAITVDARSQTEYGTLRSYLFISATDDNSGLNAGPGNISAGSGYNKIFAPTAFIQFAGFTAGKTDSFFDFDTQPYTNSSPYWSTNEGGTGVELFAYTAQFGNGLSASIAAQNADGSRLGIADGLLTFSGATTAATYGATQPYANQQWPDVVANLRIDQAWGSAQIAGLVHQVRAQDTGGITGLVSDHPGDETGWAVGGGLKFNLPMLGKGDYVMGGLNYAKGVIEPLAVNEGAPNQVVTSGFPIGSGAVGVLADAVVVGGGLDLTQSMSFTAGYEHHWNSQWKTSLWGDYGKISYSDAASTVLAPGAGSATWSLWQIGSRTTWTPVANLDLSVEVMYNSMDTGFSGATVAGVPLADQNWVSGLFRVQRNFYP